MLYILCKYACAYFRNIDINTYSAHVYDYTLNSCHSGIKLPRYLYIYIQTTWLLYIVYGYYFSGQWPSLLVATPAIAWATSLNRTTVARAIAAAVATTLRSVAAAIANKFVMRNIDQSNGEKAFRISPTSFNITLLIGCFYPGRIPNNGTAVRHQL